MVSLQHEYGIFGGRDGDFVIHLLRGLKKPVVTTLHTVLERPTPGQRVTLRTVCALSDVVVVQADGAVDVLVDVFDVPREKVVMIPHGAPDVPFLDSAFYKRSIGTEGRRVLLTFGLLSPNKGIEYAIEAVARLVEEFPDLLYVVVGATHPEVKKRHGERYRLSLERLVREKGLQNNVVFHNRFVSDEELGLPALRGHLPYALSGRGADRFGYAGLCGGLREGGCFHPLPVRAGSAGRGPGSPRPLPESCRHGGRPEAAARRPGAEGKDGQKCLHVRPEDDLAGRCPGIRAAVWGCPPGACGFSGGRGLRVRESVRNAWLVESSPAGACAWRALDRVWAGGCSRCTR